MHVINPTNTCTNSAENAIKNIDLQKTIALATGTLSTAPCHKVVVLNYRQL